MTRLRHRRITGHIAAILLPDIMYILVRLLRLIFFTAMFSMSGAAQPLSASTQTSTLADDSLDALEQHLTEIDTKLAGLAECSLRGGAGAIGYRSRGYDNPGDPVWVEIHFNRETPLDELILVPAVQRNNETGISSDAFPEAFRVLAGSENDSKGHVIATVTPEDKILPRIAPLVIPTPGITASWIRIESTQLTPRAIDRIFVLQFAEIMAFNGQENVALHREMTTSPNRFDGGLAWDPGYATDGFVPYIMKSGQGQKNTGYISTIHREPSRSIGPRPSLTVDLQKTHRISRIHLHPLSQADTFPQATETSQGFPQALKIEVATLPDFSDGRLLLDCKRERVYDLGPIMCWNFPATNARFVRLTALKPYIYRKGVSKGPRIGFAEIEIFSEGANVALGKKVSSSYGEKSAALSPLTDGHNLYGTILPIRVWLNQLAQRHELEAKRPRVAAELQRRYTRQKMHLKRTIGLAILLGVGIVIAILIVRLIHTNQIKNLREQVAANLHDELGANLYAIRLLGQLAKDSVDSKEDLLHTLDEISGLVDRSSRATRNCIDRASIPGIDLPEELRRTVRRFERDQNVELTIENEERLIELPAQTQYDLLLFTRECLVNISRHAEATRVKVVLQAEAKTIDLTVRDNGSGISRGVPESLLRRARVLRGHVKLEPHDGSGSSICLSLKIRGRFNPARLLRSTS